MAYLQKGGQADGENSQSFFSRRLLRHKNAIICGGWTFPGISVYVWSMHLGMGHTLNGTQDTCVMSVKRQEGSNFSTFRPPDSTAPVFATVMFYAPMLAEGVVQNNLASGKKPESYAIKTDPKKIVKRDTFKRIGRSQHTSIVRILAFYSTQIHIHFASKILNLEVILNSPCLGTCDQDQPIFTKT